MLRILCVFLLAVLCCFHSFSQNVFSPSDAIVTYNASATPGSSTRPNQPVNGVMAKWVRTPRVSWSTTNFKCYIWNGMAFRLRFPNNYNPNNATKYPVVVFWHGGGETGSIYDNEDHLYWGAQLFEQRINNGEWNGFLLFPQETSVGWDDSYFSRVDDILDTLQKYNNSDADRVLSMGLSSGGYGAVAFASAHPDRVAAVLASSPAQIRTLSGTIPDFVHVPVWMANGGVDVNPDPWNAFGFFQDFRNAGGKIYQSYYVGVGHGTWTNMWDQKNASGTYITTSYWNTAHKAQPLVYAQNQQVCSGSEISSRMGISAGYYAYEWQKDGGTIGGATANEYTATEPGTYRVRFMRKAGGAWSAWTPNPVVISTKACATDTLFAEHFTTDNYFNAAPGYTIANFGCQAGIMTTGADAFTQDATGVQGNRFLANYTIGGSSCPLSVGDRVWNTYSPVTVAANTTYEYSFYAGAQSTTSTAQLAPTINGVPLISGSVALSGTGNASWKKYTYTWNSGAFTWADLGIINRSVATTGNDFVIDEITFKLAPALPVPGCTGNTSPANNARLTTNTTATLTWSAAANAASYDVYLWTGATAPASPNATVTGTSYSATGLTGNTLYSWYIVPKNSNGVAASGCGNNQTSFTTAVTPTPPSCAVNASPADGAVLTTNSTASLTWSAAATATSYDVYLWRNGTATPTTATATVTGTSYGASGLTSSSVYNWYVVPRNAVGAATGCISNVTDFTTAAGPSAPACTGNASPANGATLTTTTTATLTWSTAATATSYDVYLWRNGTTAPTTRTANVTTTSYSATGLTASAVYNWYIVPRNTIGAATGCSGNTTNFTTAAGPAVPACVTNSSPADDATVTTTTTATLTWTAASTATSYDVYLWTGTTVPTTARATVTTTSYSVTGLTGSTAYNWYIVPKNAAGAATGCVSRQTNFTTATAPGIGTGLKGDYYNTIGLTGSIYTTRTDATVNFQWGTTSPYRTIDGNTFSVRWTGYVQPLFSQTYTFYTSSDDGVRLWVNGQQIINNWTDHSETENSGTITLVAGVKYSIRMEYFENGGDATAELWWSSPSTTKAIIPQKQLYLPTAGARMASAETTEEPEMRTATIDGVDAAIVPANTITLNTGVYPNPVRKGQAAILQINSDRAGVAAMQLVSTTGTIVQRQQLNIVPGTNTKSISTTALTPGMYFIRVTGNIDKAIILKLIVQ